MLKLNDGRSELWQWDTGRKLTVDADCSQVHFSNKVFGRSIDMPVIDGVVEIPDFLLQTDKDLTAWAFVGIPENGYTKISKLFKVNKRNKPSDYVFTPTDQATLGEILKRVEVLEKRPSGDVSKEDIQDAVSDYFDENPVSVVEKDPTVPAWAKQPKKPTYTAEEVGAQPKGDYVLYTEQNLNEEQKAHARDNIGAVNIKQVKELFGEDVDQAVVKHLTENPVEGGMTKTEKKLILTLLNNVAYVADDMGETLAQLRELWGCEDEDIVYKWVVGLNGSFISGTNEAALIPKSPTRAMCLAEGSGIPLVYNTKEMSPYSPVVIPNGATSVTVKCQGFRVGFNELKLVDGKWFRLFTDDSDPVANEATYEFRSTESSALYIKLRNLTNNNELTNVPEVADITFNY